MSAMLALFVLLQVTGNPIVPVPNPAPQSQPQTGSGTASVSIPPPDPELVAKTAGEAAPFAMAGGMIPIVSGLSDALTGLANLEPWSQTPKDMTTGDPGNQRVSNLLRGIVVAALTAVLAWAALIAIGGQSFGGDPAVLMLLLPRIVVFGILATYSLPLLDRSIDVSNAVTGAIGSQDMGDFFVTGPDVPWVLDLPPFGTPLSLAGPIASLLLGIVYLLAAIGTLGFLWMRDALLGVFIAVAPAFILLMAVPKLEHLGHRWAHLYWGLLIANIPIVVALQLGRSHVDLHGGSGVLQLLQRIGVLLLIPVLMSLFGVVPGVPSLFGIALALRLARGAARGMAVGGPAGAAAGAAVAAGAAGAGAVTSGAGAATWKSQNWAPTLAPSARSRRALPPPSGVGVSP
jgi:hypothetical protein